MFSETQKPRRIKKRAEVITPQPLLNNPRLATELAPLSLEEVVESLAFTLLLAASAASCCGLLDLLLAPRLIFRCELKLTTSKLQVVGIRIVLQGTLLVSEVAALAELLLPKE